MSDTKYVLIGRGKAGWHASGIGQWGTVSSSGGTLEAYASEANDGTDVYDAKDADEDAFVSHVIAGPMFDPRLNPDEVNLFDKEDREAAARMLPALGGGFQTIARLAQNEKYSGLDQVGLNVYLALLVKIPGVKFGKVRNGKVEWSKQPPLPGV